MSGAAGSGVRVPVPVLDGGGGIGGTHRNVWSGGLWRLRRGGAMTGGAGSSAGAGASSGGSVSGGVAVPARAAAPFRAQGAARSAVRETGRRQAQRRRVSRTTSRLTVANRFLLAAGAERRDAPRANSERFVGSADRRPRCATAQVTPARDVRKTRKRPLPPRQRMRGARESVLARSESKAARRPNVGRFARQRKLEVRLGRRQDLETARCLRGALHHSERVRIALGQRAQGLRPNVQRQTTRASVRDDHFHVVFSQ